MQEIQKIVHRIQYGAEVNMYQVYGVQFGERYTKMEPIEFKVYNDFSLLKAFISTGLIGTFIFFSVHRTFGAKCSKCSRTIAPSDWVRKARDLVFHLACFSCDTCGRQLSTGEQFALIDDKVMCKIHYMDNADESNSSDGR